jgi:hypothetical protein
MCVVQCYCCMCCAFDLAGLIQDKNTICVFHVIPTKKQITVRSSPRRVAQGFRRRARASPLLAADGDLPGYLAVL